MARNWKEAQVNEKLFWEEVYFNKNNNDIYDKINLSGAIGFTKEVIFRHKKNLKDFHKKKIIDLGCGAYGIILGLFELEKVKNFSTKSIIGIDPLMNFFKKKLNLIKSNKKIKLIQGSGEKIKFKKNKIDFIFCVNVLDHVKNPGRVIKECKRVLKENGELCVSVHVVYPYLSPFLNLIKYFDKNHPHHFLENQFYNLLKKDFKNVEKKFSCKMSYDHKDFNFRSILQHKNILVGLKRAISNYVLYTVYYNCNNK